MGRRGRILASSVLALAAIAAGVLMLARSDEPAPAAGAAGDRAARAGRSGARFGELFAMHGGESETASVSAAAPEPDVADASEYPPKRRVHLTGVVLENGEPAGDARILVTDERESVKTTRSGRDGRFAIDVIGRWYLRVDALKGERLRGKADVRIGEGAPKELRIELQRAGVVIATVTSKREQRPVEAARVTCYSKRADHFGPVETDPGGNATLYILTSGSYECEAEHDRLGDLVATFDLKLDDTPQHIALELPGGSAVLGRVVDDAGHPVAGVELMLSPPKGRSQRGGYRRTQADGEGRFRIDGVEAGRYELRPTSQRYAESILEFEKKDDVNDVEIEFALARGGTIVGRAVDAYDKPAAGWLVYAMSEVEGGLDLRVATARSDGGFEIDGLTERTYTLALARTAEWRPEQLFYRRQHLVRAKPGDKDVVLRAREGATLSGEVRFEGADPPRAYNVNVDRHEKEHAGSEKTFVVTDLPTGRIDLVVSAPGFAPEVRELELEEGKTEQVSITMTASTRISGRVVDAKTGAPIANATVKAMREWRYGKSENSAIPPAQTGGDGAFVLEGIAPGKIELFVRAETYSPAQAGPFDTDPERPPIVVRLSRGVRVAGRVHARESLPRYGWVWLHQPGDVRSQTVQMGGDGRFSVEGVAPGSFELTVHAEFGDHDRSSRTIALDVPQEGLEHVDVDFKGAGARLIVSLPSLGKGIDVTLARGREETKMQTYGSQRVRAGETQAIFEGLAPGDYTVWGYIEGGFLADEDDERGATSATITIEPGQAEARVTLPPP